MNTNHTPDWVSAAAEGATVITASEHIAREARLLVNQHLRDSGRTGWLAPTVISIREFVIAQWLSSWPSEQLASAPQELAVWARAIRSSSALGLVSVTALARAARGAARLIARHGGDPVTLTRDFPPIDELAFITAWQDASAALKAQGLTTEEDALRSVIAARKASVTITDEMTFLIGFGATTGLIRELVDVLVSGGAHEITEPAGNMSLISLSTVSTPDEAIASAAAHIRLALGDGIAAGRDPSICIAVPDLAANRNRIDAALTEFISPQVVSPGADRGVKPWRYARGVPLSEHPVIAAVLTAITVSVSRTVETEQLSQCLLSPFLFPDADQNLRAKADHGMRRAGPSRMSQGTALRLILDAFQEHPESAIHQWASHINPTLASCKVGEWVDRWEEQILIIGSPIRAQVETHPTFTHLAERWNEAVAGLRAMERTLNDVTGLEAIGWLREVMADIPVQPPVEHHQPIHVMSYGDIEGMHFDLLIVLDAAADTLPPPRKPLGFVPNSVLAELGIPSATAADHYQHWERWANKLSLRADRVVAISSHKNADGADLRPSTLLASAQLTQPESAASALRDAMQAEHLQVLTELALPPVDLFTEQIRGGAGLMKNIALSPFVAFIRNRTHTECFPELCDGLAALDQGNLAHHTLWRIWTELRDSAALKSSSDSDLLELVTASVEDALLQAGVSRRFGPAICDLERKRLIKLSMAWLSLEKTRAWEFTVLACEQNATASLSGLAIDLKFDRLDEVMDEAGDKHRILIDYKTGSIKPSAKSWQPGSMSEPQLPIYASCVDWPKHALGLSQIDGISFAHVTMPTRKSNPSFVTQARFGTALVHGSKGAGEPDPMWAHTLAFMRSDLQSMAAAFLRGDTAYDRAAILKDTYATDLPPLLRKTEPPLAPLTPSVDDASSIDLPF